MKVSFGSRRKSGFEGRKRITTITLVLIVVAAVVLAWNHLIFDDDKESNPSLILAGEQTSVLPILPVQHCEKYTTRKVDHLTCVRQIFELSGVQPVEFSFLQGSSKDLAEESLYSIETYREGFEGSVTRIWLSILQEISRSNPSSAIVIDGGMNTGFYSALSAASGFEVHAFELQRDCFDVMQKILDSNEPSVQQRAHLYNMGISDKIGLLRASEGCKPGYGIAATEPLKIATPTATGHTVPGETKRKTGFHHVMTIPLDTFLDQIRLGRKIAILKLDIEGAEIPALQGLGRFHLPHVQNIILEFSKSFSAQFVPLPVAKQQFLRLVHEEGYSAYKLWSFYLGDRQNYHNTKFLQANGLENVERHPVTDKPVTDEGIFWKIVDWDLFFSATWQGVNIWFTRN